MKPEHFFLLLLVARQARQAPLASPREGFYRTSTGQLAQTMGCSQQTVSRQLRELEDAGLVHRKASPAGMELSLTTQGRGKLQAIYIELSQALQSPQTRRQLAGIVEAGLKEGAYYLALPPYRDALREKLGYHPFLGTLNVRVQEAEFLAFLDGAKPLSIPGFQTDERSFGGLKLYRARINGKIPCALLLPDRTTHQGVAEIVAKEKLRDSLSLKDGDAITLTLEE